MFQGEINANTPAGDRCSYVRATPSITLAEVSSCKIYVEKYLDCVGWNLGIYIVVGSVTHEKFEIARSISIRALSTVFP
jgi:hypothetical protein